MSLTFDEFKAVSKRNLNEKLDNGKDPFDKNSDDNNLEKVASGVDRAKVSKNQAFTLGEFLEMYEIQALTLFFLVVDTFAAFTELIVVKNAAGWLSAEAYNLLVVTTAQSVSSFFVFFFVFEIISLFIAFRLRLFSHLGYVVDISVVSFQVWAMLRSDFAVECHILNFFRMWRVVRLFQSMVSVEVEANNEARLELKGLQVKNNQYKEDIAKYSSDLKKEQDARSSVEAMLQNYKDEIDTLNEALKIAALDIAEVAQAEDDFFLSDDDEDMISTDLSASIGDHTINASSNLSVASNNDDGDISNAVFLKKEEIYKEALKETKSAAKTQRSTIVINENGSFQQK